jgi:isoquinoline 1-oxidoreductase beta subunit
LSDWWHAFSSSHILFTGAAMPPWMQLAADFLGDAGVTRGSTLPYRCANQRVEYDLTRLTALTGPWRGLGAAPNLLAMESAIDECARAAGTDALAFRLQHLSDPRLAAVLQRVARDAGWDRPVVRQDGHLLRGRGLAGGIYKGMSYAAAVAQVEVDTQTGDVRVSQLWCAHDCGRMINPDQVRAQTEGNLIWCIGMVLLEELPFSDGRVQAGSFADAPIPRISDICPMQITLMDSQAAATGAGETAMVAGAGAIANALRDATGHRFSRVPVRPNDVLQALRR